MFADGFSLLDGDALMIVLSGTLLATIARCGWGDIKAAGRALVGLGKPGFDEAANRAAIAKAAPEIQRRGHLSADPVLPPDASLAKLVNAYRMTGSIDALHSAARADRAGRESVRAQAVRVFDYAGELAPVFGLVGTLFAITQLNAGTPSDTTEVMMAAIANAVLSSLYGVLTAHLVCVPIAGAIERRGAREEAARAQLISWFEDQVSLDHPRGRARRGQVGEDAAGSRKAA